MNNNKLIWTPAAPDASVPMVPSPGANLTISFGQGIIKPIDWRPIDTAPMDGTEIILLEIRRDGSLEIDFGIFGFIEISDYDGEPVYDWTTNRGSIENPTHWAPYNPPTETKVE